MKPIILYTDKTIFSDVLLFFCFFSLIFQTSLLVPPGQMNKMLTSQYLLLHLILHQNSEKYKYTAYFRPIDNATKIELVDKQIMCTFFIFRNIHVLHKMLYLSWCECIQVNTGNNKILYWFLSHTQFYKHFLIIRNSLQMLLFYILLKIRGHLKTPCFCKSLLHLIIFHNLKCCHKELVMLFWESSKKQIKPNILLIKMLYQCWI